MVVASNHTWGDRLENGFTAIFGFIPELIAALLILVIGYVVAKVVGGALARLLHRAGFDRTLTQGQAGSFVAKVTDSPARLLGRIAFWIIFLGALSLAVTALGIDALTDFVGAVFAYLPNVVAALLIFIVAGALAAAVAGLVARLMGDTPTGKVVASVAPVVIMAIAAFMILDQLKIAEDIVRITYMALMGGLALALALAFGLGGRDVAGRMLEGAYAKGQASREQVRRDLERGRERARDDAERAKGAAQERMEGDAVGGPPLGPPPDEARTAVGTTIGTPTSAASDEVDVEVVPADELDDVPPGSADPRGPGARP